MDRRVSTFSRHRSRPGRKAGWWSRAARQRHSDWSGTSAGSIGKRPAPSASPASAWAAGASGGRRARSRNLRTKITRRQGGGPNKIHHSGDRGSNAAEWADDTIPTDTPDEGSDTEGPAPAPRGGGPRPPGGPFGAPPGGDPSGEAGLPRAGSPQPTPPAARAAGHIERFVRVAHSSQPGAADSFCAPTAGDAVLPLS